MRRLAALFFSLLAAPASAEGPPLYQRLGGEAKVQAIVSETVDLVLKDRELRSNPVISEALKKGTRVPEIKQEVANLLCRLSGGGCPLPSPDEGPVRLHLDERGLKRIASLFKRVLDDHQIRSTEKAELLKLFGGPEKGRRVELSL